MGKAAGLCRKPFILPTLIPWRRFVHGGRFGRGFFLVMPVNGFGEDVEAVVR